MLQLTIALIATFNLCLGYVLGAKFGLGIELPAVRLPSLRRKKGGDDEPLVQPPVEAAEESTPEPTAAAAPEPQPAPAEDEDLMSGLAAFQAQLAQMGQELQDSQDDAEAFDANAKHIQDANHAYLETAQSKIDQLPDESQRESASAGVEEVGRISEEFDALVGEGLDSDEARAKLVEKSGELTEKVGEVRESQEESSRAAAADAAAEAGIATLDSLLGQIDDVLNDGSDEKFRAAVLVRRDPSEDEEGASEKLRAKITELIRDAAPSAELVAAYDDDQLLLMMDEGAIDEMTDRIDSVRQQIAETKFVVDGKELTNTITCAIADMPGAESRDEVLDRLREAMEESVRFGANRTFHHDGNFPTPAPPADFEVVGQTVEL